MRQIQDSTIIERSLKGDIEAFGTLIKKYQASLIALAWNILGDPDDARDVAQETFFQVYTHLDRFDPAKNFKTWLFSIGVKRSIDFTRKRKSFFKYFDLQKKEMNPAANPQNAVIEDSEIFSPLLKKLKQKERIAISLKINEGYSAKDIAEVINCSENTARVHLFNARKKLKELMR